MKSIRGRLEKGSLYKLHDHEGYVIECLEFITDDGYDPHAARVRSTVTGWTMTIHGVNVYEDGSIDWDFSTNGLFTDRDDNGVLHERRW